MSMTTKDSKNGRKEKSKLQVPFSRKVEWLETQARSIRRTAVIVALVLISLGELLSQSEVQEVFVRYRLSWTSHRFTFSLAE